MASRTFTGTIEPRADSLNIPILKFSYSTTSADRASPLGWTHLSSNGDLAVVFDHIMPHETSSAFSQGDQRLRVLRGGDVLEQLNLSSLAREAAAGPSHAFAENAKPAIAIIVKSPCLAVRYPMRNEQTRRLQIKFSSDADYSNGISILSKLGCPITHSGVVPLHQASSNRPFPFSSQTPSLPQIGGGAHSISPGLLSRPTGDQYQVRPWSSSLTEPSTPSSFISSFNNSSTNASSYDQTHGRPNTSALSISPIGSTYGITTVGSLSMGVQGPSLTPFPTAQRDMSPFFKERPATAPALPDVNSLSQILPPKRELPFAKPGARSGSKQPPHSRAPASKQTARPANSGASSSFLIAQSRASTSNTTSENPSYITNHGCSGTAANGGVTGSSATPNPPFRRPLPRENLGANTHNPGQKPTGTTGMGTSTLFANRALIYHTEENSNVSNAGITSTPATTTATPQLPPERSARAGFVSSSEPPKKNDISSSDLSAYLSTPNPERTALVESWVCSQLENDAFLALCQDVEGVWRRIAFGY
ncbi:hypothetical protein EMCG_05023 [[Emmonsia] crescens]|uniref:Uncharacterized protein n=1 Tax=[Emmonsia] crescens TaxID=73230 RepID=A0A0G2HQD6_9EURO|nr:hypothetical protein EMCG_05023 [Emmonsia crescens UAMH 3008]